MKVEDCWHKANIGDKKIMKTALIGILLVLSGILLIPTSEAKDCVIIFANHHPSVCWDCSLILCDDDNWSAYREIAGNSNPCDAQSYPTGDDDYDTEMNQTDFLPFYHQGHIGSLPDQSDIDSINRNLVPKTECINNFGLALCVDWNSGPCYPLLPEL